MSQALKNFGNLRNIMRAVIMGAIVISTSSSILLMPAQATAESIPVDITWNESSQSTGNWRGLAASSDGTILYATGMGGGILKSTDSGESWTNIKSNFFDAPTNLQQNNAPYMIAVSADGNKVALIDYGLDIYTSPDGGVTWTNRTTCGTQGSVACGAWEYITLSPDGSKLFVGGDSRGWYRATNPFSDPTTAFTSANFVSLTEMNNSIAAGWTPGLTLSFLSSNGNKIAGIGKIVDDFNGIYTSSDAGSTWTLQAQSRAKVSSDETFICETASNASGTHLYAHAANGNIYKSTDLGVSWVSAGSIGSDGCPWYEYTFSVSSDGSSLVVTAGGVIYFSYDYGVNFANTTTLSEAPSGWSAVAFAGSNSVIGANNWGKLYKATISHFAVPSVQSSSSITVSAAEVAKAAEAQREAEVRTARAEITTQLAKSEALTPDAFKQANIAGVTKDNFEEVQAEILALPAELRTDINQVLKVARKYEVVGNIASDQIRSIPASALIEIGLIPADSKNKTAILKTIQNLAPSERDSYAEIKAAIDAENARLQARKDRLAKVLARRSAR